MSLIAPLTPPVGPGRRALHGPGGSLRAGRQQSSLRSHRALRIHRRRSREIDAVTPIDNRLGRRKDLRHTSTDSSERTSKQRSASGDRIGDTPAARTSRAPVFFSHSTRRSTPLSTCQCAFHSFSRTPPAIVVVDGTGRERTRSRVRRLINRVASVVKGVDKWNHLQHRARAHADHPSRRECIVSQRHPAAGTRCDTNQLKLLQIFFTPLRCVRDMYINSGSGIGFAGLNGGILLCHAITTRFR